MHMALKTNCNDCGELSSEDCTRPGIDIIIVIMLVKQDEEQSSGRLMS